jgi:molybdate transport system regulatory protein
MVGDHPESLLHPMRQAPRKPTRRAAARGEASRQAVLTIRVDFGPFGFLGPGKIQLMELISKHGSISAAGKEMGMSYRRAWLLVETMNRSFKTPLVQAKTGGKSGGGAEITATGREALRHYRAMQKAAEKSAAGAYAKLAKLLR